MKQSGAVLSLAFVAALMLPVRAGQIPLDEAGERWVAATLKSMSLEDKIGQLLVPALNSTFTTVDGPEFERLVNLVRTQKVGGFHVFGATEPMPEVLLNAAYGGANAVARRGDPFAAAALLNRLQRESAIPLMNTADFEGGVGYILAGATRVPRAMAIAATHDPQLAYKSARLTAEEGRRVGVHLNLYPVVDVNTNPQNPVINLRSFGDDAARVAEFSRAYIQGLAAGGMLSTAKHFPGHGGTGVDSHVALPVVELTRQQLEAVELEPFRAAIDAGADAIMSAHIAFPQVDPSRLDGSRPMPATLSRPILTDLLRRDLKFSGLIVTDALSMVPMTAGLTGARVAALAVRAGNDLLLQPPDPAAAFAGIRNAVAKRDISEDDLNQSVERILRAKARLKLHVRRDVDLESLDASVGTRSNEQIANEVTERAVTLVSDERNQVPLKLEAYADVLYVSVVDRAGAWRETAPSRAFLPALWERWTNVTAVEISNRTTRSEYDLVRTIGARADAIIVSIFARNALPAGMPLLTAEQVSLVQFLSTQKATFVATIFGNPYAATLFPKLPTLLVTYDTYDAMEVAVVKALRGDLPLRGKLPISLPGIFPSGHGLQRAGSR